MTTIREIVTGSLRLLEVIGAGEAPTAEDAADALSSLSSMMDSWSIDGNKVFTESVETFNLVAGTDTYTIGSGGTFNATRPVKIRAATINAADSTTSVLKIMSAEEYASQPDKFISGLPYGVYYDSGYPLSTFRFTYIPNQAYVLKLYSEKPLTIYSSLNDTLVAPQGFERALRFNLAVEIAPEYGKEPSPLILSTATESRRTVENYIGTNDKNTMQVDDALLFTGNNRTFNILANR